MRQVFLKNKTIFNFKTKAKGNFVPKNGHLLTVHLT